MRFPALSDTDVDSAITHPHPVIWVGSELLYTAAISSTSLIQPGHTQPPDQQLQIGTASLRRNSGRSAPLSWAARTTAITPCWPASSRTTCAGATPTPATPRCWPPSAPNGPASAAKASNAGTARGPGRKPHDQPGRRSRTAHQAGGWRTVPAAGYREKRRPSAPNLRRPALAGSRDGGKGRPASRPGHNTSVVRPPRRSLGDPRTGRGRRS